MQDIKIGKSNWAEALCFDEAEQPRISRKRSRNSNQKCKHQVKQNLPNDLVFNKIREKNTDSHFQSNPETIKILQEQTFTCRQDLKAQKLKISKLAQEYVTYKLCNKHAYASELRETRVYVVSVHRNKRVYATVTRQRCVYEVLQEK